MSKIDERIDKAAREYAEIESAVFNHKSARAITFIQSKVGFIAGARWALSHQWRSVEEELPPYNTDILGMENESVYLCKRESLFDGEDVYIINDAGDFNPTHWMPIPPQPEARKEDEE